MKRIERTEYLNKLIAFKDKSLIKVITGIRRCGKSTIMEIYRDWLKRQGVSADQIIYLNFEDYDFYELRNPHNLYAYIKPLIHQDKMTYIFFDEIQHVEDFPDIINSLNLKPTVDLYITGSNAYMLSSEIATLLSGRYVEIAMLPLHSESMLKVSEEPTIFPKPIQTTSQGAVFHIPLNWILPQKSATT